MSIKCPKCKSDNSDTATFCADCGTKLPTLEDINLTETLETPKEELTTGTTFAGRYQIIEELGKGGMGRVYKVLDKEVNAKVALKLIKPEIAADKRTIERFRNELKIARDITHKNVCRMYDLGKEEGAYFITMEYVSGEDLKSFIRRAGLLSAGKAMSIAAQVCDGLLEAHRLGVVHRDLKPQNIMIDKEGNARIMDFGIARSLRAKGITGSGVMIGTPEYMSPEQVDGKEADQRADIYSLGVILYEMVTGRVPFEGDTPFSIGVKQKSEIPRPPIEINEQLPEDLNRVILMCMEKEREKRYQSVSELHSELMNLEKGIPTTERIVPESRPLTSREITVKFSLKKLFLPALIVIAVVVIGLIIWRTLLQKETVPIPTDIHSIAVLPFDDLSPQKDQEAFCESISEYIITKLTKFEEIKVIQGDSIFHYKDKEKGPQSIGKELDVDAVLHGSVRSSNNNLLVVAKLMNVSDGSVMWASDFTEPVKEAFNIQSSIALQIAENLKTELSSDERDSIEKRPTENMEAYELYQRGRYLWRKRDEGNVQKSVQFFEQAIGLDPDFALAYAGLADSYISLTWGKPLEEARKVEEYALKALALDDTLAEPHVALGLFKCEYEWDFDGANQEFEQAIALNPGYATAHLWYSRYFRWIGKLDKTFDEVKLARELDPLSPSTNRYLAAAYIDRGQYNLALEAMNRVLEIDPNHIEVNLNFGFYYLGKKMYDEALEKFKEHFGPDSLGTEYWDHFICAVKGDAEKAREGVERIEERLDSERESITSFWMAQIWALLDEPDKVFFYLNKAYEQHDFYMYPLKTTPYLDDYRSDPRYKELLKKMNLE